MTVLRHTPVKVCKRWVSTITASCDLPEEMESLIHEQLAVEMSAGDCETELMSAEIFKRSLLPKSRADVSSYFMKKFCPL